MTAFLATLVLAFASIAEEMVAPSSPPPLPFVIDKILAAICFCICCFAVVTARIAAVLIWLVFIPYVIFYFVNRILSGPMGGVPLFAAAVTACITLAVLWDHRTSP